MRRSQVFHFVLASIFFVMFAAPATASALQRTVATMDFDSSLSQDTRIEFIDSKFDDYVDSNLTGRMVGGGPVVWLILEGDGEAVDNEILELEVDDRVRDVETLQQTQINSRVYPDFETHTELDPRGDASVASWSNLKRSFIRVKFPSGTSTSTKMTVLDDYFNGLAKDGLGGVMIAGGGHPWMPMAIEGSAVQVDSYIQSLKNDSRIQSAVVFRSYQPSSQSIPRLWSHSHQDVRQSSGN